MEAWLARAARMHPERVAVRTPAGPRFTYSELFARAREAAGGLAECGITPGARVGLALTGEALIIAVHACLLLRAAAVPLDLRLTDAERAARAAGTALVLESLPAGEPVEPPVAELRDTATVMFTSGTSAEPKEVHLSIENWLAGALGSALGLGLARDERWLCPLPLSHVGGLAIPLRSAIYGTEVLLHERFDTEAGLASLSDPAAKVTLVSLVPTMLARLLDAGLRSPPTLRWVLLGGGPISPTLLTRAEAAEVPVAASYGMTEACSQIATDGWPLLGVELRIDAPDRDGAGEVLVRGPSVARDAMAGDGWLHTGDLGSLDERGRLAIAGRISDTIITGGENVAPAEVESALLEHPDVLDVAVLGRPDPEWGEAVVAQVVAREPAAGLAEAELRAHCLDRLAPFKVPKRFELVSAVPRGPTGKLLRRELR